MTRYHTGGINLCGIGHIPAFPWTDRQYFRNRFGTVYPVLNTLPEDIPDGDPARWSGDHHRQFLPVSGKACSGIGAVSVQAAHLHDPDVTHSPALPGSRRCPLGRLLLGYICFHSLSGDAQA